MINGYNLRSRQLFVIVSTMIKYSPNNKLVQLIWWGELPVYILRPQFFFENDVGNSLLLVTNNRTIIIFRE